MTPAGWAALIATGGLIVTIWFQIVEWRRTHASKSLDIVLALEARFQSDEFAQKRRLAARSLQVGGTDARGQRAICDVLDFLETLGFLYGRRALDAETIWHFFGHWLLHYYVAAERIIKEEQGRSATLYVELDSLFQVIRDVELKRDPSAIGDRMFSRDAIDRFLSEEIAQPGRAASGSNP
jgi:hypothetical protein